MRTSIRLRLLAVAVLSLPIGACSNPYGLKMSYANYTAKPFDGEIAFSDPKLYREALINERQEEQTYLNKLMDGSHIANFTAEIVREREVVQLLSATLIEPIGSDSSGYSKLKGARK